MAEHGRIFGVILAKLTVWNISLAFALYILFLVAKQVVCYRYLSPIKNFPGPFLASVTRLWLAWHNFNATEIATVQALHKKYGISVQISSHFLN